MDPDIRNCVKYQGGAHCLGCCSFTLHQVTPNTGTGGGGTASSTFYTHSGYRYLGTASSTFTLAPVTGTWGLHPLLLHSLRLQVFWGLHPLFLHSLRLQVFGGLQPLFLYSFRLQVSGAATSVFTLVLVTSIKGCILYFYTCSGYKYWRLHLLFLHSLRLQVLVVTASIFTHTTVTGIEVASYIFTLIPVTGIGGCILCFYTCSGYRYFGGDYIVYFYTCYVTGVGRVEFSVFTLSPVTGICFWGVGYILYFYTRSSYRYLGGGYILYFYTRSGYRYLGGWATLSIFTLIPVIGSTFQLVVVV
nr:PREDICTED: uncharacterized protein LOC106703597 [Latimeria chalumnae]|eukprot:XP_014344288.1 PREDICTED: uncharacterized protein LOC106703597 [Latimeria chalumnae]